MQMANKLAEKLKAAIGRNGAYDSMFEYAYLTANTLALKAEMGIRLTAAYRAGDREALTHICEVELPELFERVKAQRLCHMENWMKLYKPFGWDIMDMRYGSLLARIDSAIRQLTAYLEGKLDKIEELEAERLLYDKAGPRGINRYGLYVSPSRIAPMA